MPTRVVTAFAVAVACALVAGIGLTGNVFGGIEQQSEDALQPGMATDSSITVVVIDRATLAAPGEPWPWSRKRHADLLDVIGRGKPAVVVYDVVFADERADDSALVAALTRTPTVIASALTLRTQSNDVPSVAAATEPDAALAGAASGVGHANVVESPSDGVVRSLPLYAVDGRGVAVPSLALEAAATLDGHGDAVIERAGGAQIGSRFIPVDHGELRINWSSQLTAGQAVSAEDLLDGSVDPSTLAGRTVIVGVSDPTLRDLHLVPDDRSGTTPGCVVVANALNTILSRTYLTRPASVAEFGVIALVTLVVSFAFVFLRLRYAAAVVLAVAVAGVAFTTWRFHSSGELWNALWLVIAAALTAIVGVSWRYVTARRAQAQAVALVAQYVPTPVARRLVRPNGRDLPEGRLTFLMTDVVDSTGIWNQHPDAMRKAMVRHDHLIERLVEANNGAVVRPRGEGDSRFAVFFAVQDAANAALAIRDGVETAPWETPHPMQLRIAVAFGEAELRAGDYYGSEVNKSARIRGLAQPNQVLASASVAASLQAPLRANDLGLQDLKGFVDPERVFEIVRTDSTSATTDRERAGTS